MGDLDKLFVSTPVLAILKFFIVMSMAIGFGNDCFDITTTVIHASLNPEDPHLHVPPGGIPPWEKHSLETQTSGLRTADCAKRLAGPIRLRDEQERIPTTEERWRRLRSQKALRHGSSVCGVRTSESKLCKSPRTMPTE